jgi:putative SOS response-associated peptidase YedK
MCGRFTQYRTREEYLKEFADETEQDIAYDPEPIGRYNVAPGTNVLVLNQRDDSLHLDPVHWGYGPEWWDKAPLINARIETAATGRMFKPLWNNGRAIVMADGWYEWKRDGSKKQPYFIYHKSGKPIFFAAIGKAPYDKQNAN